MFCKYAYNAGITQAQLLSDIVAILTGETTVSNLGAGCDQANTTISTARAVAGWTVHDSSGGTNVQVIKAACNGDAAQYKYVEINTNTAGEVICGLWESWDAGTNAGTNLANLSKTSSQSQRYSTTLAGTLYISASQHRIAIYGAYTAVTGNSANGAATFILEADRGFTWCAVGQGFTPVTFLHTSGQLGSSPRAISCANTVVTTTSAQVQILTMADCMSGATNIAFTTSSPNGVPMSGGVYGLPLLPFMGSPGSTTQSTRTAFSGFSISDTYVVPGGFSSSLDETAYDGDTFIVFPVSSASNGYQKLAVPKG